jgi:hypothetical protein
MWGEDIQKKALEKKEFLWTLRGEYIITGRVLRSGFWSVCEKCGYKWWGSGCRSLVCKGDEG